MFLRPYVVVSTRGIMAPRMGGHETGNITIGQHMIRFPGPSGGNSLRTRLRRMFTSQFIQKHCNGSVPPESAEYL